MKLKYVVEIEIPDESKSVVPEEGMCGDDYKTQEQKKELKEFRNDYSKKFKEFTLDFFKEKLSDDQWQEEFIEKISESELDIVDFESFDDYSIGVKVIKYEGQKP